MGNEKQMQPAEVTDEREAFEAEMRCEDVWGHRSLKKRADGRYENWIVDLMWDVWQARSKFTIPALRPVQVPMTREQAMAIVQSNPDTMTAIRMTEAHHGITAQAKKETP